MTTQNQNVTQPQDLDAFLASCETTDPKLAALLPSKLPSEPYQSSLIRVLINSGNYRLVKQYLLRYFYFVEYSGWHHYDARTKSFRHLRTLDEIVCSRNMFDEQHSCRYSVEIQCEYPQNYQSEFPPKNFQKPGTFE